MRERAILICEYTAPEHATGSLVEPFFLVQPEVRIEVTENKVEKAVGMHGCHASYAAMRLIDGEMRGGVAGPRRAEIKVDANRRS
jgi:hypothetical protein